MPGRQLTVITMALTMAILACAPAGVGTPRPGAQSATSAEQRPARTMIIVLRNEPPDLIDSASSRNAISPALFGAGLLDIDDRDEPYPVLAEAAPELGGDSWRVFPDGKMETTYRLRDGLAWHDGTLFTADDFVFAQRVNAARMDWGLSVSAISPIEHRAIETITAPDPRTVVVRWKQPYANAVAPELRPVARHLLEATLDAGQAELLGAHPYWTREYVGVGPYRLVKWEPGAYIEAAAFDRFALGKPKIERVRVTWSGDPNTIVARLISGDAHVTLDRSIYAQEAVTLRQEWVAKGAGVVRSSPGWIRFLGAQHRPDYANPATILDVRVRQAIAHAIDRKDVADAMLQGEGMPADTIVPPTASLYEPVSRVARTYPYDLRRTEQLMGEVGYVKGPDGFYTSPTFGTFSPEVLGIAEGDEGRETTIVADLLRRVSVDARLRLVPTVIMEDNDEMKATYPAFRTNQTSPNASLSAERMLGSRAAAPANRWSGTNKMGWSNAEHDRLFDAWSKALDRDERNSILMQIARVTSEELPYIPLYFAPDVLAHSADIVGPKTRGLQTTRHANVYEWSWR